MRPAAGGGLYAVARAGGAGGFWLEVAADVDDDADDADGFAAPVLGPSAAETGDAAAGCDGGGCYGDWAVRGDGCGGCWVVRGEEGWGCGSGGGAGVAAGVGVVGVAFVAAGWAAGRGGSGCSAPLAPESAESSSSGSTLQVFV